MRRSFYEAFRQWDSQSEGSFGAVDNTGYQARAARQEHTIIDSLAAAQLLIARSGLELQNAEIVVARINRGAGKKLSKCNCPDRNKRRPSNMCVSGC